MSARAVSDGERRFRRRLDLSSRAATGAVATVATLAALWVLVLARGTSAGPAVTEPGEFLVTVLDGLTFAGLLFIVSSGFTLVFGLMRTVNMAHGSLFLLAAYLAIELQKSMVGKTRNIEADEVSLLAWFIPLLVGAAAASVIGVAMQQLLLRWNQGQELRQAIITVAVAVILADQMLAQFGGLAQRAVWPGPVVRFFEILGQRYAASRLFMLAVAAAVGGLLWLWLNRTRIGMIIRAGVDDEEMVRALGINVTVVFGVAFFIGSFLAGMGGVMGASFSGVAPGTDGQWLLNSLLVVIIGGLGSMRDAVAGSLLYGMVIAIGSLTYASSIAVFGGPDDSPASILEPAARRRPHTLYGTYKVANEQAAAVYAADHGLASIGLRPHTVYGPGRDQGLTSQPTVAIERAVRREPYDVDYGGTLDFQYAPDVARLFIAAARAEPDGASVLNVKGHVIPVAEFVGRVRAATGFDGLGVGIDPLPLPSGASWAGLERLPTDIEPTPLDTAIGETYEILTTAATGGR